MTIIEVITEFWQTTDIDSKGNKFAIGSQTNGKTVISNPDNKVVAKRKNFGPATQTVNYGDWQGDKNTGGSAGTTDSKITVGGGEVHKTTDTATGKTLNTFAKYSAGNTTKFTNVDKDGNRTNATKNQLGNKTTFKMERKMTKSEKAKEDRLKDKYDDSDMKKNMKKQYGDNWEEVYYATIRKKSMTKGAK